MQSSEIAVTSGRDDYLDNVKGILMVSVVYVHLYDMVCLKAGWMYGLRLGILAVQMPLFMFLSGYFGKKDEKRREEAMREFLLPFLAFNTLYYLLVLCTLAAWKLTVYFAPYVKASHPYQLVGGYKVQHLTWKEGMIMRGSLYVLAPIMGACVLSLCMRCRCIFTTIGRHSLTVYLLHAFPMLYMLELFPKKFHATPTVFGMLVVYAVVVSRLLASRPVTAAYDAAFGGLKRGLFVTEKSEKTEE